MDDIDLLRKEIHYPSDGAMRAVERVAREIRRGTEVRDSGGEGFLSEEVIRGKVDAFWQREYLAASNVLRLLGQTVEPAFPPGKEKKVWKDHPEWRRVCPVCIGLNIWKGAPPGATNDDTAQYCSDCGSWGHDFKVTAKKEIAP